MGFKTFDPLYVRIKHPKGQEPNPKIKTTISFIKIKDLSSKDKSKQAHTTKKIDNLTGCIQIEKLMFLMP